MNNPVKVNVKSFDELIKNYTLTIPVYQRNYVWGTDKVNAFIEDMKVFYTENENVTSYYMGSILLHKNDEGYDIIDGQQRVTTLSILHYVLKANMPEQCTRLEYTSQASKDHIQQTHYLFNQLKINDEEKWDDIFSKLVFTVIETNSEDLAFTFFDTQNNRGVALGATDLLKAYHLRAISDDERLQKQCAKQWESSGNQEDLFEKYLWRARYWTGRRANVFENRDRISDMFQKCAITNMDGIYSIHLRQPIQSGSAFFLYAKQYADMKLKLEENELLKPYFKVLDASSRYAKEFFMLCCMMYYDKFNAHQLTNFIEVLERVLGAIRLEKSRIVRQAMRNQFLRDSEQNLLDIIVMAYRPDEVINYLTRLTTQSENKADFKGVRDTYWEAAQEYLNVKKYYELSSEAKHNG